MRGRGVVVVLGRCSFGRLSGLEDLGGEDQGGDLPLLEGGVGKARYESGEDRSEEDSLEQLHRCLSLMSRAQWQGKPSA